MANHEKIEQLLKHIGTIRSLINYHKRMMIGCGHGAVVIDGEAHTCEECNLRKALGECPTVAQLDNGYLAALEESLRLLKVELNVECAKLQQR